MSVSRLKDQQLLGVARTASKQEIRRRYLELCKRHHPDVAHSMNSQQGPDIRDITAAYQRLTGKQAYTSSPSHHERTAWQQHTRKPQESPLEEQQQWTRYSLLTGLVLVVGIVAYAGHDPRQHTNPLHHYRSSPWEQEQQQQQRFNGNVAEYRQWRKS